MDGNARKQKRLEEVRNRRVEVKERKRKEREEERRRWERGLGKGLKRKEAKISSKRDEKGRMRGKNGNEWRKAGGEKTTEVHTKTQTAGIGEMNA